MSASESRKGGELHILVVTEYTQSFREFLTKKGVKCGAPSDAVNQGAKIWRDKDGHWHHEQPCTVQTFDAECTLATFRTLMDDWSLAVKGRKPSSN